MPGCNSNHHHNYYVKGGQRTYYSDPGRYLQVADHYFVERHLIDVWITYMVVAWYAHRRAPVRDLLLLTRL